MTIRLLLCDSLAWTYEAIFVPAVVLILPSGFGHEDEASGWYDPYPSRLPDADWMGGGSKR